MRKTFTTIALVALLGTLAASCQKENYIDQPTIVSESCATYTVQYTIDGVSHTITLIDEESWSEFLNYMLDLAENGYQVNFRVEDSTSNTISAKEVVTYSTTDRDDAYAWAEKMGKNGYSVGVSFDKEKKIYICYAIK